MTRRLDSVLRRRWPAPAAMAYAAFALVGLSAGVLLSAQIRDYGIDKSTIGTIFITFAAGFMLAGATAGALVDASVAGSRLLPAPVASRSRGLSWRSARRS